MCIHGPSVIGNLIFVNGRGRIRGWRVSRLMSEATQLIKAIENGDPVAARKLFPLVYRELRKVAELSLGQERPGHTLQPTSLVHEAYLRLVDVPEPQQFKGRNHFFAAAAEAMRRILVDNARRKHALKR